MKARVAVSSLLMGLLAGSGALASEVTVYSECALDGAKFRFGIQRSGLFELPVYQVDGDEHWNTLEGTRQTDPMGLYLFAAHFRANGRSYVLAYDGYTQGETEARFGWVEAGWKGVASDFGTGACTVLETHGYGKSRPPAGPTAEMPETMLATCSIGEGAVSLFADAEAPHDQYWRVGDTTGAADIVFGPNEPRDDTRVFVYQDGPMTMLVGHSKGTRASEGAFAFVVLDETTAASGAGQSDCKVEF